MYCLSSLLFAGTAATAFAAGRRDDPFLASRSSQQDTSVCDLRDFGAVGDGKADDSSAVAAALKCAGDTVGGGKVVVPRGAFRVTSTLAVPCAASQMQIVGEGWGSILLWETDGDFMDIPCGARHLGMRDFAIASTGQDKNPSFAALKFHKEVSQSFFDHLLFYGQGELPGYPDIKVASLGSGMDLGDVTDTVEITGCVMWFVGGTGIKIGKGSEVRIEGGRIIGTGTGDGKTKPANIGVHVTGNNGGVHLTTTDIIGHHEGLRLDSSNGQGSNREIFVMHATFDSSYRGVAVYDNSYVSITGIWAASCFQDNIWTSADANPLLALTGGTIFNGGSEGSVDASSQGNGITLNGGSFTLSGVVIRNNKGRGLWIPNEHVGKFSVTGCKFYGNGQSVKLDPNCKSFSFVGNVIEGETDFGSASGAIIESNVMPSKESDAEV